MKASQNCVFIVEDDPSMRNALKNLLRSVGLEPSVYGSAQEFLEASRPNAPSCLILDVRLPGLSGLDLQRETLAGPLASNRFRSLASDPPRADASQASGRE